MAQAFAPRMPRGCSWLMLTIVSISFAVRPSSGQAPPPADAKAAGKAAPVPPRADPKPAAPPEEAAESDPEAEVFVDPKAKALLAKFNLLTYVGPTIKVSGGSDDRGKVLNMVAGNENLNKDFLKNYVNFFAIELTKRDYINAIVNPPAGAPANSPQSRGLERAVDALTKPIVDARFNKDKSAAFLDAYSRTLFDSKLVAILDDNYLSRIGAMIVLGMAGYNSPAALDLYAAQLKDPDQVIWAKSWACRGLTNASQQGAINIEQSKAINGAEAVIAFLDSDPKLPWPAKVRALEALGSLRLATANKPGGKVDAASAAFRNLVDPGAAFEVRAWAAWALGMIKVSGQVSPYNFALVGQEIGELAIDLGSRIVEEYDDNQANFEREKEEAHHLSSLLIYQVIPSLSGVEGINDSGLLNSSHPNMAAVKSLMTKLDEKIKAVARESYELIRAGGTSQKDKRNDLDSKVADLKQFIGQISPKGRKVVPDGPEFPAVAPQVAGAAGR